MTAEEVMRIMNSLDFNCHMAFIELLFPVLNLDTKYALITRFKFKYNPNDPLGEFSHLNVFEFMKGLQRCDIRGFMTKMQCPLLLLNFTQWKLENEISNEINDPKDSYALELLYLFNDFLIRDYTGVFIGGKIQRVCNSD